ncbi:unnamed protein product [Peronospora belbahrii]|uniref:Serine/threonine-protein phosphatase PGAM5, mitochondrial n=1 Tax=Peronospora belbahrii TaxID=622444 RepID=A0AAU9L1Y9_9STRA|nr:unnamed protein product [Peronospora belbahrii]CAH0518808.1 unnamed protein product [Peronospora belbahrii]
MSLELDAIPSSSCQNGDIKTKALRIQELSLASDRNSNRLSKGKVQRGNKTVPRDLRTSLSTGLSTTKNRGNKRTLWTSVSDDRRQCGEVVEVEGLLVVAEQVDRGQTRQKPPVFRTLGSIHCVLVRKNVGLFLETVSQDRHHTIVLNIDAMDLVHERFENNCKFQLRYRQSELKKSGSWQRAVSYAFMTSSTEEHFKWLNGIFRHQALATSRDQTSSWNERVTGSGLIGLEPPGQSADLHAKCNDQEQRWQTEGRNEQPQPSLGDLLYPTPARIKHFILVRHGHYINAHVLQVLDSQQVLSQMGRKQAELTGKYLGVAHNRVPTRHDVSIYHSDMTRAVETAVIIATDFQGVSLNSSSLLREGWPGTPYSTDFTVSGETAATRKSGALDALQKQSFPDVERMEKAFNWFLFDLGKTHCDNDEESYCILVCHANLIRYFLCRALGVDPTTMWGHFEINHCGVTRIDVCSDQPTKIIAVNETGHLPLSLITSSEDHL